MQGVLVGRTGHRRELGIGLAHHIGVALLLVVRRDAGVACGKVLVLGVYGGSRGPGDEEERTGPDHFKLDLMARDRSPYIGSLSSGMESSAEMSPLRRWVRKRYHRALSWKADVLSAATARSRGSASCGRPSANVALAM